MINGGRQPSYGGTSRMNREVHVRICERLGVQFPGPTRQRWSKSSGHNPGQVCVRETRETKPADDASLRTIASSKPGAWISSGKSLSGA